MKIDSLQIAEAMISGGMQAEQAQRAARKIADACNDAQADMVSLQDLEIVAEKSDARMEKIARDQISRIVTAMIAVSGFAVAAIAAAMIAVSGFAVSVIVAAIRSM